VDLSETITPRSDQQNFDDYLAGSRTVTISGVTKGNAEQPVNVELTEYPGRPFKPNKSMRRVLVMAWGTDSSAYIGRRLTLIGNPEVRYGGKAVGGIEIAGMSGLSKPLVLSLTETRGKKRQFTVQPLPDAPTPVLAPGEIPELVVTNAAIAAANGTTDEYLAYLTEQGAPAFILEYVNNSKENKA
jgi:hypothetical protein